MVFFPGNVLNPLEGKTSEVCTICESVKEKRFTLFESVDRDERGGMTVRTRGRGQEGTLVDGHSSLISNLLSLPGCPEIGSGGRGRLWSPSSDHCYFVGKRKGSGERRYMNRGSHWRDLLRPYRYLIPSKTISTKGLIL